LKMESKVFQVTPFVKCWSGNCSFGIRLSTKNSTREEIKRIYEAFKHLTNMDWPGGFYTHRPSN
jgi:hypothetical protein